MSIQRYDINPPSLVEEGYPETTPNNDDGQIVYYTDHAAEVEGLKDELHVALSSQGKAATLYQSALAWISTYAHLTTTALVAEKAYAALVEVDSSLPKWEPRQNMNTIEEANKKLVAEVARLTGERDAARTSLDKACEEYRRLSSEVDHWKTMQVRAISERDAAVARAAKAEDALFYLVNKANRVTSSYRHGIGVNHRDMDSLYDAQLRAEEVESATAQDAKPDHIPGVGKMVSERERRLSQALRDLIAARDEEAQHGATPVSRELWKLAWKWAEEALKMEQGVQP